MSMECLERKMRKARRKHTCDYCGAIIEVGEQYDWSKHVYDGELYEWHSHERCSMIAREIWDYVDPDEGMTGDDFCEGCEDVCREFICPDCPNWDKDNEECENCKFFCTDRLAEFFEKNELYRVQEYGVYSVWKARPRETKIN